MMEKRARQLLKSIGFLAFRNIDFLNMPHLANKERGNDGL